MGRPKLPLKERKVKLIRVELWRKIPGVRGYSASTEGRIRSDNRQVWSRDRWIGKTWRRYKRRILQPKANKSSGYLEVNISICNEAKMMYVHHLVLLAYKGPPPSTVSECRHYPDPDKSNNKPNNLWWGTSHENKADIKRSRNVTRKTKDASKR
jgi:hypothetical protein